VTFDAEMIVAFPGQGTPAVVRLHHPLGKSNAGRNACSLHLADGKGTVPVEVVNGIRGQGTRGRRRPGCPARCAAGSEDQKKKKKGVSGQIAHQYSFDKNIKMSFPGATATAGGKILLLLSHF